MAATVKKRLRVFAGPNGSGKSTITKIVLDHVDLGIYVNADEIKVLLSEKRFVDFSSFGLHLNEDKINERYYRTMGYLYDALKIADSAYMFDNSAVKPNMFAVKENGLLTILSDYIPKWFETYFINVIEDNKRQKD